MLSIWTMGSVQCTVAAVSSVRTSFSVQGVFAAITSIWTVVAVQRAVASVTSVWTMVAIQVVVTSGMPIGTALVVKDSPAAAVSSVMSVGAHTSLHAPPAIALIATLPLVRIATLPLQAGITIRVAASAVDAAPVLVVVVVIVVVATENAVIWRWGTFNQVDGNFSRSLYRLMKGENKN